MADEIDDLIAGVTRELEIREVFGLINAAASHKGVFVAQVLDVRKVKTVGDAGQQFSGKAEVTFQAPNEDQPETIETDWLSIPRARAVARIAQGLKGHKAVLYKLNAPDPTGKVSQGFRRLVWIGAANDN